MMPIALVANWISDVTRWQNLRWLKIWCRHLIPPGRVTALTHCLQLPYWQYQLELSWHFHQPESYQLSLNNISHSLTSGPQVYMRPKKLKHISYGQAEVNITVIPD